MFDDDYVIYKAQHLIITIVILVVILGLGFGIYVLGSNTLEECTTESGQTIAELNQTSTSNEIIAKPENNVIVENVQVEADKVINTDTYIDNTQSIVNEAQRTSYVLPITLAVIFAFVIIIFERWLKHKKEKDERTERILNTPLQTYEQVEATTLKDKYKNANETLGNSLDDI